MPATDASVLRLQVPFIVQIGRRQVSLGEMTDLLPGALLELPVHAEDDLEILINNKPVGRGRAVKVGENYGIQVTTMEANAVVSAALGAGAVNDQGSPGEGEASAVTNAAPSAADDPAGEAADKS